MRLAQGLTDGEPPGLEVARARLAEAVSTWQRLEEEWVLPDADHIFGVGYPLADGWGTGWSQLGDGIDSSCPRARLLLRPDTARRFASADPWVRQPLARRFSDWAALEEPDLADLIAFETAVCCACLLYTSPSPRDKRQSRMPSSA